MTEPVLRVEKLSKSYRLYDDPVKDRIKDLLFFYSGKTHHRLFQALQDVSFEIAPGEIVGIVGRNGAGKTTLLKVISGISEATSGRVTVRGKVTALLNLGMGFHEEFTGRENILYGGLVLGMHKQEILSKAEGIIEFAELGPFIDQPFRTYSAGMKTRLAFAVATAVEPEILLIDEALSAGDAHFVGKCLSRIHELCASGATVLFVSHNMDSMRRLCSRGLLLHQGRLAMDGPIEEVVSQYDSMLHVEEMHRLSSDGRVRYAFVGDDDVTIDHLSIGDQPNEPILLRTGSPFRVKMVIACRQEMPSWHLYLRIKARDGTTVTNLRTSEYFDEEGKSLNLHQEFGSLKHGSMIEVISDHILLPEGDYSIDIWLMWDLQPVDYVNKMRFSNHYRDIARFSVFNSFFSDRTGLYFQPVRIRVLYGSDAVKNLMRSTEVRSA